MTQKKQTARKTTGKHWLLSSALHAASSAPSPSTKTKKRAPRRSTPTSGTTSSRPQTSPFKSCLKRQGTPFPKPGMPNRRPSDDEEPTVPVPVPSTSPILVIDEDVELPFVRLKTPTPPPDECMPGPLVAWHRPTVHVLDHPISVCMQFATWLESEKCVHEDAVLRAVERDGRLFLSLAQATVSFDNALRGHSPHAVAVNGDASPFGEHARTLRVFAELLKAKISEGNLSRELEAAVLRDGEPLLRFALCCLEFDKAIRGSDGTASS